MSQPFKLYRLQKLDSQLDMIKSRQDKIDLALRDDLRLRQATLKAENTQGKYDKTKKALGEAENYVQQQRLKIEQKKATLYSGLVKNPKELQDLENEVASLERYLVVLEDRQLESMLAEEEAGLINQTAAQELEEVQKTRDEEHTELHKELAKLESGNTRFQVERQAATNSIEADDLKLYTNLRSKRRGIAVAKVSDRACSACGSTLNAALLYEARSPSQITHCDTCGRILYAG